MKSNEAFGKTCSAASHKSLSSWVGRVWRISARPLSDLSLLFRAQEMRKASEVLDAQRKRLGI